MPVEAADFHIEEYRALRKEIEWMLKDYHALERNIALLCGGILVWLFNQPTHPNWIAKDLGWFIPFLFACFGTIRAYGIFSAFNVYHEYMLKLENIFASSILNLEGWDHFLNGTSNDGKRRTLGTSRFAGVFWVGLDLVLLAVALLFGLHIVK